MEINKSNAMSLKNFRYEVAIALTTKNKPRVERPLAILKFATKIVTRPVVPHPSRDTRLDNFDHFPVIVKEGVANCPRRKLCFCVQIVI